jgi:hypothetical protein
MSTDPAHPNAEPNDDPRDVAFNKRVAENLAALADESDLTPRQPPEAQWTCCHCNKPLVGKSYSVRSGGMWCWDCANAEPTPAPNSDWQDAERWRAFSRLFLRIEDKGDEGWWMECEEIEANKRGTTGGIVPMTVDEVIDAARATHADAPSQPTGRALTDLAALWGQYDFLALNRPAPLDRREDLRKQITEAILRTAPNDIEARGKDDA